MVDSSCLKQAYVCVCVGVFCVCVWGSVIPRIWQGPASSVMCYWGWLYMQCGSTAVKQTTHTDTGLQDVVLGWARKMSFLFWFSSQNFGPQSEESVTPGLGLSELMSGNFTGAITLCSVENMKWGSPSTMRCQIFCLILYKTLIFCQKQTMPRNWFLRQNSALPAWCQLCSCLPSIKRGGLPLCNGATLQATLLLFQATGLNSRHYAFRMGVHAFCASCSPHSLHGVD